MLTEGGENPTYQVIFLITPFWFVSTQEGDKSRKRKKKSPAFPPGSVVHPIPFLHLGTQNIYISFPSQPAHLKKKKEK